VAKIVDPEWHLKLSDYESVAQLASSVADLRAEASGTVPHLEGRTIWMVNSTAKGGGVAEMLPADVSLLRELGVDVQWVVIEAEDHPEFFALTKRIHNLIHGEGDPSLSAADRELYETVSRENADWMRERVRDDDILVIHDPQPAGMGAMVKRETGVRGIWRCHIGLDERLPATEAAWEFLRPYVTEYDRSVFSAPEYIPGYLAGRAVVIHPSLDPLSHKNRVLPIHKLVGILCSAGLLNADAPRIHPRFPETAQRLQPDGTWASATLPEDIELLYRPIVTQVSRWDRLKGFVPLLQGFARLKSRAAGNGELDEFQRNLIHATRLVLAGPDPESVQDDPEAVEVLEEIEQTYLELDEALQHDVAILSLPLASRKNNALMVNAIQRCSSVVVQNSLREGFGLTATEAMWKEIPVIGTRAVGLRQQIRDRLDGRLVNDAENPDEIASVLEEVLADEHARERWGRTAQHRVHHEFLTVSQLRRWLELLAEVA
jgi:trehalose synthase